jgi:hypothetical protein
MDDRTETYKTRGSVDVNEAELVITSPEFERDLPGGSRTRVPLANVRFYDITLD